MMHTTTCLVLRQSPLDSYLTMLTRLSTRRTSVTLSSTTKRAGITSCIHRLSRLLSKVLAVIWIVGVWTLRHGRFQNCHGFSTQPTDLICSERAVIHPFYERKLPVKPHVDYMLFMVPHTDDGKSLHNLQGKLNGYTNFTNFQPTCKYPIMLNIKCKELQGEDPVSPELHLAA